MRIRLSTATSPPVNSSTRVGSSVMASNKAASPDAEIGPRNSLPNPMAPTGSSIRALLCTTPVSVAFTVAVNPAMWPKSPSSWKRPLVASANAAVP